MNTIPADVAREALIEKRGALDAADALSTALTPPPAAGPDQEAIEQALRIAYRTGCQDVHNNYQEDSDPDFSEAASDYVASLDLDALILSALEPRGDVRREAEPGTLLSCLDSWIDVLEERDAAKKRRWLMADDKRGLIMTLKNARAALAPVTETPEREHGAGDVSADQQFSDITKILADPIAVHINMLRGGIAKPSIANIIHLYGEEAVRAALPDAPGTEGV